MAHNYFSPNYFGVSEGAAGDITIIQEDIDVTIDVEDIEIAVSIDEEITVDIEVE